MMAEEVDKVLELFLMCLDMKMPNKEMYFLTNPIREAKTEDEKQAIARELIEELKQKQQEQ